MATFTTGDSTIPKQILDPWLGKMKYGSRRRDPVRIDPDEVRGGRVVDLRHR